LSGGQDSARRALDKAYAAIAALGRWRARFLAAVLGALAVLAMAPVYQIYLLIPAFSGLLWLSAAAQTRWHAFVVGWWFGAGYFGASLYWVSFALLVDAERFAWLIPFAVFGFAFGLGIFGACAAWAVRAVPGSLSARALMLAGAWTVLEWVRAWLFTGLPWNPVGSAWAFSDAMMQGASVIGVFGLSLFTVLFAAGVGALVPSDQGARRLVAVAGLIGVAGLAFGEYRLSTAVAGPVDGVRLRLIQPNIAQAEKWKRKLLRRNMMTQIDLMLAPPAAGSKPPTHVIWAETAAPFFIANSEDWRRVVGQATPPGGLTILGAPRVVGGADGEFQVANALLAITETGAVAATYDKSHLVPFGEYVPLSDWLPLDKITQGQGAFTPGAGPVTLTLKGLPPVSPLICYEVIFPHQVTDPADRPQWLLNLTNDAWYGKTAGPHQHFVTARFRAVEEGLPAVRVAFTGISGIIDAYGRVQSRLGLGEKGFVDGDLPQAIPRPGAYARWGNTVPLSLSIAIILAALFAVYGRAQGRNRDTD